MLDFKSDTSLARAWDADSARRWRVAELRSVYSHRWDHILEAELERRFEDRRTYDRLKLVADTSLNMIRWAVDRIASIYSRPVTREVEGYSPETADTLLAPYLSDGELDLTLDQACRLTFLCRNLFARPLVVERAGELKILLDLITPDRVIVDPSPDDPLAIRGICYMLPGEDRRYVVWTRDYHATLDHTFRTVESGQNPYGMIPVVPLFDSYPAVGFFHEGDSSGLYRATVEAGVAMTHLRHLMKMQSFKQLAIKGQVDRKTMRFVADPCAVIEVPHGDVEILDWQADIRMQIDVILQAAEIVLNLYGIRPEAVRGSVDAASGYALELKMHDLQDARERLRIMWAPQEQALYRTARVVWEVERLRPERIKYPTRPLPLAKLIITYPEIGPGRDPGEVADLASKLKSVGYSEANVLRELYQKDEAWIEANRKEREEEAMRANPLIPSFDDPTETPANGVDDTDIAEEAG